MVAIVAASFSDLLDVSKMTDTSIYLGMAVVATVLFLLRLILMLFAGVDGDVDFGDMDMDGDFGHTDSTASFSVFSVLSMLAFFMGAGWMGFAARWEWGMGSFAAAGVAATFGAMMSLLSSFLMYQMHKLNEVGGYNIRNSIGKTARVYLTIPARGEGAGQIEVIVDGQKKVVRAMSTGKSIAAFSDVRVVDAHSDNTLIVEPCA